MKKLIKGSKAAKEYMAKIRAKKGTKSLAYAPDRMAILKNSTKVISNYRKSGLNRKDAIKNATLDVAFMSGSKKAAAKKAISYSHKKTPYTIGSVNTFVYSSGKAIDEIKYRLERINKLQNDIEFLTDLIKTANPIAKKAIKADIIFCKKMIRDFKIQNNKLKKLIK